MEVNIFFDEENEVVDVIWIPQSITNIEKLQIDFFEWLFDKKNNHKYWIIVNNEKKYCNYGVDAFVDWINSNVLIDEKDKARVILRNSREIFEGNNNLFF